MRPVDIVRKVAPKARPAYVEAFENGDGLLAAHGINTPQRLAHFLAQILHESGGLKIAFENGNYTASRIMEIFGVGKHSAAVTRAEAERLAGDGEALFDRVYGIGNPKKAKEFGHTEPGDGFKYRGGGILQTTGKKAYERWGDKIGVDLVSNPELIVTPAVALRPALFEWTATKCNELADNDDLHSITRKINGGFNGLADRQAWYNKVRPLCSGVTFAPKPKKPAPVPIPPPPDIEPQGDAPAPPAETKPAVKSTINWAALGTFLTAILGALTDWRMLAVLIAGALAAYIIIQRNGMPDIGGWFRK